MSSRKESYLECVRIMLGIGRIVNLLDHVIENKEDILRDDGGLSYFDGGLVRGELRAKLKEMRRDLLRLEKRLYNPDDFKKGGFRV